jgi:hypothetical protein
MGKDGKHGMEYENITKFWDLTFLWFLMEGFGFRRTQGARVPPAAVSEPERNCAEPLQLPRALRVPRC